MYNSSLTFWGNNAITVEQLQFKTGLSLLLGLPFFKVVLGFSTTENDPYELCLSQTTCLAFSRPI
jgi:hypothetical protein